MRLDLAGRASGLKKNWYGLLLVLFLTTIAIQQPASAMPASLNLSNAEGDSISSQIAVVGGNVYVVWVDNKLFNDDVFFAASTDNGASFGEAINLSANEGPSGSPQIAAVGNNVYVTWRDTSEGDDEIFVSVSADNGASFAEPINVSSNEGSSINSQIVASGDDVYVIWEDASSGNSKVLVSVSTDQGGNFTTPVNISSNNGSSTFPQIAVSGDNIYAVWSDTEFGNGDILISASSDNGANFGVPVNLSSNEGASINPQIISFEDNVYATWIDLTTGNEDIFFAASSDSGASFGEAVNLSSNEGVSFSPQVASDGDDHVYVVWQDTTSGNAEILFASSSDNGDDFGAASNISSNDGSSLTPQVAVTSSGSGSNVYVVWGDDSIDLATSKLFIAASSNDGGSFGCDINLSGTLGSSFNPDLAVSQDGGAFVSWSDIAPGNFETFLQADVDPLSKIITVDSISNVQPRWGIDSVEISGGAAKFAGNDTVTVVWGDGDESDEIPINEDCKWGPVSHSYDSSSTGANAIVSKLISGTDGEELTSSAAISVDVQKHATSLTLNPVPSVRVDDELSVSGILADVDAGVELDGLEVSFEGSGADSLANATTLGDGSFSSAGPAPPTIGDAWEIFAMFEDESSPYLAAVSEIMTFDTANETAVGFPVSAGFGSFVQLTGFGFNASITFDEVTESGEVLVSECDSPENYRYSQDLDRCIRISPALQMAAGSTALVNMSFAEAVPEGMNAEEIDMFHEESPDFFIDITQSRDLENESVIGRTSTFSNFLIAFAVQSSSVEGAYRFHVVLGDGNLVSLRDVGNAQNSSATASFDKSSYALTDVATLNITDSNGNVDPTIVDRISAAVMSDTSEPQTITISLVETGADTGIFLGQFGFTDAFSSDEGDLLQVSEEDTLSAFYISGGSLQAIIDGVSEAGVVDLADYVVEPDVCFQPVGGAVELLFVDENAKLGENGLITVTMSYSNSKLLGGDPSLLQLLRKVDQGIWEDITLRDDFGTSIGVIEDDKTVTGQTSGTGQFTLAFDVGCSGGAGGGFGRPGAGIVVDFVASIAKKPSPPPDDTPSTGGGSTGGGSNGGSETVVITNNPTDSESYFTENPLDRIQVANVGFSSSEGTSVFQATTGQQVSIAGTFTNPQQHSQSYSFIVQVLNEDGYTIDIFMQDGMAEAGQTAELSSPWTPEDPGTYVFKIFVWDDISSAPIALSEPTVKSLLVAES